MRKALFLLAGLVSLCLGIIGIFLPGLPTTPFILLSGILFARSSPTMYNWLLENKYLGKYIVNYQRRKGMTKKQKIYALSLMWVMVSISAGLLVHSWTIRIVIISAAVVGTIVMGFVVPLAKKDDE